MTIVFLNGKDVCMKFEKLHVSSCHNGPLLKVKVILAITTHVVESPSGQIGIKAGSSLTSTEGCLQYTVFGKQVTPA